MTVKVLGEALIKPRAWNALQAEEMISGLGLDVVSVDERKQLVLTLRKSQR